MVSMPMDNFFSKDEILGGLPAKRARALLFLIENRVGLLKARSNRAMDPFFTRGNSPGYGYGLFGSL